MLVLALSGLFYGLAAAVTIQEINGPAYLSPFSGQKLSNITGIVTAIGSTAFYLRDESPDTSTLGSPSIQVFTGSSTTVRSKIATGDLISISGTVSEFRSDADYILVAEIDSPGDLVVVSTGHAVTPVVVGAAGLHPPTELFSSLDGGNVYSLPGNQTTLATANVTLQPDTYAMDFWQNLSGELVTVTNPVAVNINNSFGDIYLRGDWPATGINGRGGLTMTANDSNPEVVVGSGDPLDGSSNAAAKQGDELATFTGIVTSVFGWWTVLPLTGISVTAAQTPLTPPASTLASAGTCSGITIGQYNVDNLSPAVSHLAAVADHIANSLNSPDLVFLQEIGDNDGATDDGVVSANTTLADVIAAIEAAGGATYAAAQIDPVDDMDGGEPGLNIRVAYLYNPDVLTLVSAAGGAGTATGAVAVDAGPHLSVNPGRLDPSAAAWVDSRKPLVAEFHAKFGRQSFFAINVHLTAKLDGTSLEGDARPPVNGGEDFRMEQTAALAAFVGELLDADADAKVVLAGDFNEFTFVEPFQAFEGLMQDADEVVGREAVERYTYLFENTAQQLDHLLLSAGVVEAATAVEYEHVHVNTWAQTQASDHDPSVAKLDLC